MTRQETIDKAVDWALAAARDDSHGYDQEKRWGPDYDCSSFVITAWQQAGVPVRTEGASYTGNMRAVFLRCSFRDVTAQVNLATGKGLQKGDVLLILEAMKMENEIMAPRDGVVASVNVNKGATVNTGDVLLSLN